MFVCMVKSLLKSEKEKRNTQQQLRILFKITVRENLMGNTEWKIQIDMHH